MSFELSVALSYLIPRRRQLSVSIISLISISVISLVVWLIVVFFSVTDGLQTIWVDKLVTITAPIRVTPKPEYFESYYYRIDRISAASDFSAKTIGAKRQTLQTDPYDPSSDQEIPSQWPQPDVDSTGQMRDLVKGAFAAIDTAGKDYKVRSSDYETTLGTLHLQLMRGVEETEDPRFLSQPLYLASFDSDNAPIETTLFPMRSEDFSNLLFSLSLGEKTKGQFRRFFDHVQITHLKTSSQGWILPYQTTPEKGIWKGLAIVNGNVITRIFVPSHASKIPMLEEEMRDHGVAFEPVEISFNKQQATVTSTVGRTLPKVVSSPLFLMEKGLTFSAKPTPASIERAQELKEVLFQVEIPIQGVIAKGIIPYTNLEIAAATPTPMPARSPLWASRYDIDKERSSFVLPTDSELGDGILLPKGFREHGALIGDRGHLSYYSPTASSVQEQRVPVYVAGFYDPGIIPVGGKLALVNRELTSLIQGAYGQEDNNLTNGINVYLDDLAQADNMKQAIRRELKAAGLDKYWNVETYREYEFTKDIIEQLQSEKHIWSLLATVIIVVACSNIISMLIILVNDKKKEIGILMSMGASPRSIAAIFGCCGMVMGMVGSIVGTLIAVVTLSHLQTLLDLIATIQGYAAFNSHFYGDIIPDGVSPSALTFVFTSTIVVSLLAGLIPAIKACRMRPAAILRAE